MATASLPQGDSAATGYILVALVAVFFGIAPSFAKLAFDGGAGPVTLQLGRFMLAVAVLWAIVLGRGLAAPVPRRLWPLLAGLITSTALASFGYMTSVSFIPVPLASLTFFVFPLMVGPLSHFAGHERMTPLRLVALAVGFAGLALLLGADLQDADPAGVALAFGAGSCVAVTFLLTRQLSGSLGSMHITAIVTTGCLVIFGIATAAEGLRLPTGQIPWIGFTVNVLCYVVGLSSLYGAIARLGSVRVAVVVNMEPVVSLITAGLLLGQVLGPWQMLGAGVVIAGILLMQVERIRRPAG
ncbi:MAG: DMT family transporter [Thalassobaculaceae bacterium]|nr:DMT family transporter [Thalassobaculaceae bacterium]